ncbi:reprolysin-like metallopeptidase [Moorena sp. SIO3A5]|uniref:reprolysin-like metallopeptidase n=1 Tax=Moorena sp. SIO3A5 TaxID=2607822 RepID=UPI00141CC3B8|nr:hypothetical protein [Moorena sp. SIO3A5]NEP66653.1 hypothetical protein [Moorena sp. SIO3A5]
MSNTFSSADSLLDHHHWDTNTITYSFYNNANSGSYYGPETGVSEISEKTKDNIRSILETLERYIAVDFHEVADTATDYGLLRYMVSDGPGYAYTYLPEGFNTNVGNWSDVAGDVHLNQAYDTTGNNGFADDPGNHGYMTVIHEIGHSLGLKHPNPYEDNDHGPFLPFNEDNTTNTVMSYNFAGKSAITPMIYDIQALQSIYGAREYNHGDTTYSFDSVNYYTDGSEYYGKTKPIEEIKQTLWDSGGVNTLDFSNLTFVEKGYHFDMNEGGILTTQEAYNDSSYKARSDDSGREYVTSEFGTAIAFGTVFENLINSNSNDYIIANSAANIFSGYELEISTGDDLIKGWNYLDTLDLSNYAFSSVTQTQSGDDLILGLGSDSSITLKDYHTVSESDLLKIIFEEESQAPVWEEIIIPDTITNISDVQYVQEEPQTTNTAPTNITLDGNSVKEFSKNGTTIAKLTTKDVDWGDSHTYKLLDDAQGRFKIDGNRLKVKNGHLIDFDDNSSHSIKIRTTDSGGKSYEEIFTIEVLNQNFAPTDISLDGRSVKEFSKNGTTIARLTTKDVDWGDSHTYKLLDDAQGRFKIDGNRLKVKNGHLIDFDDNSSHSIKIRTTDSGGKSYEETFSIEVLENQNSAPTDITLSGNSVKELSENGTTIARLTTKDVDWGDSHTYKLLDDAQGRFKIVDDQLKVKDGTLLDFDVNSSHPIKIRTTDSGGKSYEEIFTIEVLNQNFAPTDISLDGNSVKEFSKNGTTIARLTTKDVDWGDSHTYKLLDDAQGRFKIVDDQLKVKDGTLLDFDVNSSHPIKIRTTDSGGKSYEEIFTIEVLNQNWESKSIRGDRYDNRLEGGHGDDRLWGNRNNDTLIGGSGHDTLSGGSGDDSLVGGFGNDFLRGTWGNDTLHGGSGHDTLGGGQGDDSLSGGVGNDRIMGDVGNDTLEGSSGEDNLSGGSGDDLIEAGTEDDSLRGGKGGDTLKGGSGNDYLRGDDGNDSLEGGSGNDSLIGASGDDTLDGGSDHDTLKGSSGNNYLIGGSGDDLLDGGRDHDSLEGGSGNDYLIGGSGDDLLDGGQHHDFLKGGSGNDYLIGGSGNDTLNGVGNGSRGNGEIDVLVGGAWSDTFILGDDHRAFYQGKGDNDYAEIYDLESKDIIQLYGVADQYDLVDADNGLPGSTALYFKNDLIAVLHDVSVSDVSSRLEFLS